MLNESSSSTPVIKPAPVKQTLWNGNLAEERRRLGEQYASPPDDARTRVYFDPKEISPQEVEISMRELRDADKLGELPKGTGAELNRTHRHKAKFRAVCSHSWVFSDGTKNIDPPTQAKILSGCMVNLWSSDFKAQDLANYTINRGEKYKKKNYKGVEEQLEKRFLNEAPYRDACRTLFNTWFDILFNKENCEEIVLPLAGGGVYLISLNNDFKDTDADGTPFLPPEQVKAQKIIVDSMLDAASAHPGKRVILCLPAFLYKATLSQEENFTIIDYARQLAQERDLSNLVIDDSPDGFFRTMATNDGVKRGALNPGSDRSIGGAYEECHRDGKAGPLEEQIAQLTSFVKQQACNPGEALGVKFDVRAINFIAPFNPTSFGEAHREQGDDESSSSAPSFRS